MKNIRILIISLLLSAQSYAFDCKLLSDQLLGVPLNPKLEKLDGYRATNFGRKGENSLISFWKQDGKIQESIKMHYQGESAYMVIATFRGYNQEKASSALGQMASKIGKSNLTLREGDSRPFYYVNCNDGMSAALFINELHAKQPVSYIVNLSITNETTYKDIYGKSSPSSKNF